MRWRSKAICGRRQYLFDQLYAAGVDYDDVVATLGREGIDKFAASFTELFQGIAENLSSWRSRSETRCAGLVAMPPISASAPLAASPMQLTAVGDAVRSCMRWERTRKRCAR